MNSFSFYAISVRSLLADILVIAGEQVECTAVVDRGGDVVLYSSMGLLNSLIEPAGAQGKSLAQKVWSGLSRALRSCSWPAEVDRIGARSIGFLHPPRGPL